MSNEKDIEKETVEEVEEVKEEATIDNKVEENDKQEKKNDKEESKDKSYHFFDVEREEPVEKKSLPKLPMYFYIIAGVVVAILVLIIALVVVANGDEETPKDSTNTQETAGKDDGKFNDASAKKIYESKLPFVGHYVNETNTYNVGKVTFETIDASYLRAFAYLNIDFKDGDLKAYNDQGIIENCEDESCKHDALLKSGLYSFDAQLLQDSAKKIYGKEIVNGDFNEYLTTGATYKDNVYYHNAKSESNYLSYHHREYVSYELVENTLYVYDKYLYIYGELDSKSDNYNIVVYADSAKKRSLGKGTYLEADNLVDFIVPNYDRKKSNYKHTFEKSSDRNWYWVSSEPVQ